MRKDLEIAFRWKDQVRSNRNRIAPLGRLDVGVDEGNYQAIFEGKKAVIDATGVDGGAILVSPDGKGLLDLGDMFPAEVQARRDEAGMLLEPQFVAKIKRISIELELFPAREDDLTKLRESLDGQVK